MLRYSIVQQRAALNQGEICREIGLIQLTESCEEEKKVIKPKTYQRTLEKAGYLCVSFAKVQTGFLFFFI